MSHIPRRWRAVFVAAAALALCGCAVLEGMPVPGPVGGSAVLDGELRTVDTRRGRMEVRPANGRSVTVRYDGSTRVHDGVRTVPIPSLRKGERVRVWATPDRRGELWADRVEVRSAQGVARCPERLDGRVTALRPERGWFSVQEGRAPEVRVYVPHTLPRGEIRRLERLRPGDRVRLEVVRLSAREAELVRFR